MWFVEWAPQIYHINGSSAIEISETRLVHWIERDASSLLLHFTLEPQLPFICVCMRLKWLIGEGGACIEASSETCCGINGHQADAIALVHNGHKEILGS